MIYPATDQYIELAYDALNNGEIIVYPTDTLYGFGVDATNTKAIQNLNRTDCLLSKSAVSESRDPEIAPRVKFTSVRSPKFTENDLI